jgi:large subunit ribosomal protein L17
MRHRKAGRRLGRTTAHRKATVKYISVALITHNAIDTTQSKSKELRGYSETLNTMA